MTTSLQRIIVITFSLLSINTSFAQLSNDSLIAYYPFDNDVNDMGPSSYNATLIGGSYVDDASGTSNAALQLNGIDDYVNLSSFATAYRDNAARLSVYFKIKFIETGNNQTILSLGNSGESLSTNVFEIEYENNQLQVETEVGSATTNYELRIDSANTLFDNQWHEILITFDSTNLKYYRDGTLIFDDTYVPALTTTTDMFLGAFGGTSSNDCCFAGIQIDELQFYNRILDQGILSSTAFSSADFSFYPNPVNDVVVIQSNKFHSKIELSIINLNGQLVRKFKYENTDRIELDLDLVPGIYFIELLDADKRKFKRDIKIVKN